jgi:predicted MFS family arabinose efflux permease
MTHTESTGTETTRGRIALMVGHCAGMVDMVALPIWVGALIAHYRFMPQQAGGLVTLFLAGAVAASLVVAPKLNRLRARWVATLGFAVAALAFLSLAGTGNFATMAALHALAGCSVGAALSVTHGTIARSANPHRQFAVVGIALGFFAVAFLAATPALIARAGGAVLFQVFAAVMALGALTSLIAFPTPVSQGERPAGPVATKRSLPPAVWFGIVGIAGMALVQAMTFSFMERAGIDRGFGREAVAAVLVALGIINLFPSVLAAALEKRWTPRFVMLAGAALQGMLVATLMMATTFVPYALAASVFVAVMIFTHTFAFGLLARIDTSGRALAATPAMLMIGAAIGPVLGGTLVQTFGYSSLGVTALILDAVALLCFLKTAAPKVVPATMGTAA